MTKRNPKVPVRYKKDFLARVRAARLAAGYTDARQFCLALGVSYSTYNKYETRSLLPHHLVIKFCKLTSVSVTWLFAGTRGDIEPKTRIIYDNKDDNQDLGQY